MIPRRPMRYSGLMFENKPIKEVEKQDMTPAEMDVAEGKQFMKSASNDKNRKSKK